MIEPMSASRFQASALGDGEAGGEEVATALEDGSRAAAELVPHPVTANAASTRTVRTRIVDKQMA